MLIVYLILDSEFLNTWVPFFAIIIIATIVVLAATNAGANKVKIQEQNRLKREEEKQIKVDNYNALKCRFFCLNGTPDKTIIINELDINSEIHVYEEREKVFILGKEYSFSDILSCELNDDSRVIQGKVASETKSNNKNVIGRALVGAVVAGPAGAIIGGATAKKHTEHIQGKSFTFHDYSVLINVNSISEPIIRINTGRRKELANEIVGLMNVIISRK